MRALHPGRFGHKFVLSSLFFVTGIQYGFAQLYCAPGGYLYANNRLVFVNEGINLASDGNIYLRNQSQVIQGEKTNSSNIGNGTLSVFQEGTSDAFDYNYWCAPVGVPDNTAGNSAFGITLLHRPTSLTASTAATILPNNNLNGTANPLAIASGWIWKFVNGSEYSNWIYVGSASSLAAGEGFTMKGTQGTDTTQADSDGVANNPGGSGAQRYDFRGKPNDGRIAVSVMADNFTLTGNPYPSALHLNAFLLDPENTACSGIAYFWEQDKTVNSHFLGQYVGGYGTYSPISLASSGVYVAATFNTYNGDGSLNTVGASSNLAIARKYSPIGQGFMVNGVTNGAVYLKNSHRIFYKETQPLSRFERTTGHSASFVPQSLPATEAVPPSHLVLNVRMNNNQHIQQLAFVAEPSATDDIDRGIDAESPNDFGLPYEAAFLVADKRLVITGTAFHLSRRIPLIVKAETATTFTFELHGTTAFDPAQPIFIYDVHTNSYHDIRETPYSTIVGAGVETGRFELAFANTLLSNEGVDGPQMAVITDAANDRIHVQMPENKLADEARLFDMSGRLVYMKEQILENVFSFNTSLLSEGVYVLMVQAQDRHFTRKVLIRKP